MAALLCHFLRNVLAYLPRKADNDCLQEPRWLYDRRNIQDCNRDLAAWIGKRQTKDPKLVTRAESNIGETLTFDRLPRASQAHEEHRHARTLNEEIKRRIHVVRIPPIPNRAYA